ncbi:MAG: RnfH family protein [Geobacteraceae bacterium]|nr:RnfH family protein [Geobacteraceae bacterium]
MIVFVNGREVSVLPGMTVRHALMACGLLPQVEKGKVVSDEWGNRVGLDGALSDGMNLYVG